MVDIFCEEGDHFLGLGLCGLMISPLDIRIELLLALIGSKFCVELVMHAGGEYVTKEGVHRVRGQYLVELVERTELGSIS
jgi:hypothetical protein